MGEFPFNVCKLVCFFFISSNIHVNIVGRILPLDMSNVISSTEQYICGISQQYLTVIAVCTQPIS